MRWLWFSLGLAAFGLFMTYEFGLFGRIRPDPYTKQPFGTLYFEEEARYEFSATEFAGRYTDVKADVERALGASATPHFAWVTTKLYEASTDSEGKQTLTPRSYEISYGVAGNKNIVIKLVAEKADRQFLYLVLTRARLLEKSGKSGVLRDDEELILNGLGYCLSDPDGQFFFGIVDRSYGYNRDDIKYDDPRLKRWGEKEQLGWLSCVYLQKIKGWDAARIAVASKEELKAALQKTEARTWRDSTETIVRSPFEADGYRREQWARDVWQELRDKLGGK